VYQTTVWLNKPRSLLEMTAAVAVVAVCDDVKIDVDVGLGHPRAGASTPYKRWSKCTVEKVGGSVFAET